MLNAELQRQKVKWGKWEGRGFRKGEHAVGYIPVI